MGVKSLCFPMMSPASSRTAWLLLGASLSLGCGGAPRADVAVIHVADPVAPRPASSGEPLVEETAPKAKPPREKPPHVVEPEDADPDSVANAKALFKEGAEAYSQGNYALALLKFQGAYGIVPLPPLLFNIATAELRLGMTAPACAHFRQYVADGDPGDPRIVQVSQQVTQRCP